MGFRTTQYYLVATLTQQKLKGVHSDTTSDATNQNTPPRQIIETSHRDVWVDPERLRCILNH